MWPFGAGGINHHFVYWPPHLNVKIFPLWFKEKVKQKYEEFYPWWEANWEKGVPSWHKGKFTLGDWQYHPYGVKRLQGMINFMNQEDWSRRIPEFQEYIILNDKIRGTNFKETFPEMEELMQC